MHLFVAGDWMRGSTRHLPRHEYVLNPCVCDFEHELADMQGTAADLRVIVRYYCSERAHFSRPFLTFVNRAADIRPSDADKAQDSRCSLALPLHIPRESSELDTLRPDRDGLFHHYRELEWNWPFLIEDNHRGWRD